jgi:glycosidase
MNESQKINITGTNRIRFSLLVFLLLIPIFAFTQDHSSWTYNQNIYEVNTRQYTASGTFASFATHLDRLQEMGVGILWFMPVHPIGIQNRLGSLGSPYSVLDYYGINPEFGTLNEFKALVDSIHARGMYVLIDWVANHTSWDNNLTATHPEWYATDGSGNFIPPPGTNWSDVIQLDYSKQGLRDYMIAAMSWWVSETGIDGFRFDAVSFVPDDFWTEALAQLKTVKPDIFLLAEDDGTQYPAMGFSMNYSWGLHAWGSGVLKRIYNRESTAVELANYMNTQLIAYPDDFYRMYFTSNHDENAWYGTVFEQFGDAAEVFAVLTATMDGMPLIYGGQEAGLNKRLAFFDKDQIPWQTHPFGEMYSSLLHLKKKNRALWNGSAGSDLQVLANSNQTNFFTFLRQTEHDRVLVIANLSPGYNGVTVSDTRLSGQWRDIMAGDTISLATSANLVLPGWGYRVYEAIGPLDAVQAAAEFANEFQLFANYPNPFNPATRIRFSIAIPEKVRLEIYDTSGRKIGNLLDGRLPAGLHEVEWNGAGMSSGVYIVRMTAGRFQNSRRILLLR